MSDWNEAINTNSTNSEEQETHKEKTENMETRAGTKTKHNLSTEVVTEKRISKTNKDYKGKEVKILAEVRNTPENLAYFDLQSYGKLALREVSLKQRLHIKRKEEKENVDEQTNPIPSPSGMQTLRKQKQSDEDIKIMSSEIEGTIFINDKGKPEFEEKQDEANLKEKSDEDLRTVSREVELRKKYLINDIGKPKENDEADVNVRNVKKTDNDLETESSEIEGKYLINDIGKPKENDE